jgi:hypothetical protein
MPQDLPALEAARSSVLRRIAQLEDMRPGSIVAAFRRCGKPNCHCALPDSLGHGPQLQFSYKKDNKTHTVNLANPAAFQKVEQEIAQYRNFEQLSRELIELNQQICEARPLNISSEPFTTEEKKRLTQFIGRSHKK